MLLVFSSITSSYYLLWFSEQSALAGKYLFLTLPSCNTESMEEMRYFIKGCHSLFVHGPNDISAGGNYLLLCFYRALILLHTSTRLAEGLGCRLLILDAPISVSYTHLTLPTILLV